MKTRLATSPWSPLSQPGNKGLHFEEQICWRGAGRGLLFLREQGLPFPLCQPAVGEATKMRRCCGGLGGPLQSPSPPSVGGIGGVADPWQTDVQPQPSAHANHSTFAGGGSGSGSGRMGAGSSSPRPEKQEPTPAVALQPCTSHHSWLVCKDTSGWQADLQQPGRTHHEALTANHTWVPPGWPTWIAQSPSQGEHHLPHPRPDPASSCSLASRRTRC